MNKQEAIEKLESRAFDIEDTDLVVGLTFAKHTINQIDEPEKPVLSTEEVKWIEELKVCYSNKEDQLYIITRQGWGNGFCFSVYGTQVELPYEPYEGIEDTENVKHRLVNAILYGYEVEKEKLYTVKFSNEDFGKIYIGIFKNVNKLGISSLPLNNDDVKSWFTEDELKRFKFWDNPAFEIEEVEE